MNDPAIPCFVVPPRVQGLSAHGAAPNPRRSACIPFLGLAAPRTSWRASLALASQRRRKTTHKNTLCRHSRTHLLKPSSYLVSSVPAPTKNKSHALVRLSLIEGWLSGSISNHARCVFPSFGPARAWKWSWAAATDGHGTLCDPAAPALAR
jgi:hypothetical protein